MVLPPTVRFLVANAWPHPAMVCAFGVPLECEPDRLDDSFEVRGLHVTFLNAEGTGKADTTPNKITIGPSYGWPIVVAPPNDGLAIAVTEGVEDALTVHQVSGMGAWAAGSAGRLAALAERIPNYIETVTVHMHNDEAGRRGAHELANILTVRGVEVLIASVP
jgi:hypothetical protein